MSVTVRRSTSLVAIAVAIALVLIRGDQPRAQDGSTLIQDVDAIITWQLPSGQAVELAFIGTLNGGVLEGTVDDGEKPVTVTGAVAIDGSISGTLTAQSGAVLGTFAGDETGGTYTLSSLQNGGTFSVNELTFSVDNGTVTP